MTSGDVRTAVAALRRQLSEASRRAESLRRVIESISGELAIEPLLTRIVVSAVELIGAQYGTIGLVVEKPDGPVVRTAAAYNMPPEELGSEMAAGVGLAGRVLRDQEPLLLRRYGDLDQVTLPNLADHVVIGMPIWWSGRMVGFFGIGAEPPHQFSDEDCETLTLFARHAAIAIENARRYEWEQRRTERFTLIARIGHIVTADLRLEELLQKAVDTIRELLGYPHVAIPLVDPNDPTMLVLYPSGGLLASSWLPEYRFPIGHGITGAAAYARTAQLVNDVAEDPRYVPTPGVEAVRAELAVPILLGERLLGVLNVESQQTFTDEDASSLQIIADQLAIAIDHARRYTEEQERRTRLELIATVGQRIGARLDPRELFLATVEELHGRLGYDHVSLFLLDPADPMWLVYHAHASNWAREGADGYRQRIDQGLMGAAARLRTPQVVDDVAADPRYVPIPGAETHIAELAVPILQGERLVGVLDIAGRKRLGPEDVTGIQIIADQLAVAIDNARLFSDTQQALGEMGLLYETSQRISTAMDVDEVVIAYLEQVAARGSYACTVVLYEHDEAGERRSVVVRGAWRPREGLLRQTFHLPYTRDALDPPLDAGQTVVISNVHEDPRVSEALREMQRRAGRPALALIPLMVRQKRIGSVVLSYPDVHPWRAEDLRLYQATAAQLATAIDSRGQHALLGERGRQLAVLEERRRLARDLHDSVTQLIFSMTLIAQSIAPAWRRDPAEGERRANRVLELSQAAMVEMRALLAELRPDADPLLPLPAMVRLEREGLVGALQGHFVSLAQDGLRIEMQAAEYVPQAAEHEEALFRIVQEALNNIVKHAKARGVTVQLKVDGDRARLMVADDGIGLPGTSLVASTHAMGRRSGLGLQTMRERAERIGGTFNLETPPGGGTVVYVNIPRKDSTR